MLFEGRKKISLVLSSHSMVLVTSTEHPFCQAISSCLFLELKSPPYFPIYAITYISSYLLRKYIYEDYLYLNGLEHSLLFKGKPFLSMIFRGRRKQKKMGYKRSDKQRLLSLKYIQYFFCGDTTQFHSSCCVQNSLHNLKLIELALKKKKGKNTHNNTVSTLGNTKLQTVTTPQK